MVNKNGRVPRGHRRNYWPYLDATNCFLTCMPSVRFVNPNATNFIALLRKFPLCCETKAFGQAKWYDRVPWTYVGEAPADPRCETFADTWHVHHWQKTRLWSCSVDWRAPESERGWTKKGCASFHSHFSELLIKLNTPQHPYISAGTETASAPSVQCHVNLHQNAGYRRPVTSQKADESWLRPILA